MKLLSISTGVWFDISTLIAKRVGERHLYAANMKGFWQMVEWDLNEDTVYQTGEMFKTKSELMLSARAEAEFWGFANDEIYVAA